MMTIKELRDRLAKYPDDMMVYLLDEDYSTPEKSVLFRKIIIDVEEVYIKNKGAYLREERKLITSAPIPYVEYMEIEDTKHKSLILVGKDKRFSDDTIEED